MINIESTQFFKGCFANIKTTSINMRRLNFHFQPNLNVETMLVHRRWIDVILSTLFQHCFANVETTSMNVRRLNFYFQSNINVETALMNVDNQLCFNVDSTLMYLLRRANSGSSTMRVAPIDHHWWYDQRLSTHDPWSVGCTYIN